MKKEDFLKRVLAFAHENHLWEKGDGILAAVSGGPDSLGLLLFLKDIEEREGIRLGCCCVNHHLRKAAEEETAYVASVCRRFHIPFYRKDVDVPETRKEEKGSVETVARSLRYEALEEAAKAGGYRKIALAHHEDDQAETILFHFLRGSGMKGLIGIQPKRGEFIRPFLCVTREDIGCFLSDYPVSPCHDETNDIPDATRNKIRLTLLPRLREYNPSLVTGLTHMASLLRDEEDFMEGEEAKEAAFFRQRGRLLVYPFHRLQALHPAMQRRLIRRACMMVSRHTPDAEGVERMRKLALEGREGRKTSSSGAMMERAGQFLCFFPGSSRRDTMPAEDLLHLFYEFCKEKEKPLYGETGIITNNHEVLLTAPPWVLTGKVLSHPVATGKNQYLLDAGSVGQLVLRKAEKDDSMEPLGMKGRKRVFQILQEKGIPSVLRREWPVVADEHHIYWTCFLRGSRQGRVTEGTKSFLLLTLTLRDKENE